MGRVFKSRRRSYREILEANQLSENFYAAMAGKPQRENTLLAALGPKRIRKPSQPSGKRLEKHVLAEVLKALRHDPRVAQVERTQSGLFMEGDRYIRVGTPGKLDITGLLVGGRYFEIEVKRPGGKPDPRQAARIVAIRANGGISGYCWSAESALALLP